MGVKQEWGEGEEGKGVCRMRSGTRRMLASDECNPVFLVEVVSPDGVVDKRGWSRVHNREERVQK